MRTRAAGPISVESIVDMSDCLFDFCMNRLKVGLQAGLFGDKPHTHRLFQSGPAPPESLPQAPFDAIALNGRPETTRHEDSVLKSIRLLPHAVQAALGMTSAFCEQPLNVTAAFQAVAAGQSIFSVQH